MRFSDLLHHTLKREGGYVNDPLDPGGPTNQGVTQAVYDDWRESHGLAPRTVRQLTPDEVFSIYEERYWEPCEGPVWLQHDPNLALQVFDMAVNAGVRRSLTLLQRCVGVPEDGVVGPVTIGRVQQTDPEVLRDAYAAARSDFYRALVKRKPALGKFLPGWLKRVDLIRRAV